MNVKQACWIVTDIDGTLMDHNYDLTPALSTIKMLKGNGIPVIPCTSKTAAEVRSLRKEIGLEDPYIVENGGAVYGSKSSTSDEWPEAVQVAPRPPSSVANRSSSAATVGFVKRE